MDEPTLDIEICEPKVMRSAPRPHPLSYLPQTLSAIAAMCAVFFAGRAIDANNRNFQLASRAHVAIKQFSISAKGGYASHYYIFSNLGKTPALAVTVRIIPWNKRGDLVSAPIVETSDYGIIGPDSLFEKRFSHPIDKVTSPLGTKVIIAITFTNVFGLTESMVACRDLDADGIYHGELMCGADVHRQVERILAARSK
jgi:hypothetical protein